MMARYSSYTRDFLRVENDPGVVACRLNRMVCETDFDGHFITLTVAILDLASRQLTISSAGHPPILVRRGNGRVEEHGREVRGFPLGIEPSAVYDKALVCLAPGDAILLYSDGVPDARNANDDSFDTLRDPRLRNCLAATDGSPDVIGHTLVRQLQEFSNGCEQTDDIALVCFGPIAPPVQDGVVDDLSIRTQGCLA